MAISIPGMVQASTLIIPDKMVMDVSGHERSGKTHFSLTAPAPIVYFNFDLNGDTIAKRTAETGKEVLVYQTPLPLMDSGDLPDKLAVDATKLLHKFRETYKKALDHPEVRTIIVDTVTHLWALIRLAHFGKLGQVKGHHYGPPNQEMKAIAIRAKLSNKNLITISRLGKEFKGEDWTGKYNRKGFGEWGYEVATTVEVAHKIFNNRHVFTATIQDCSTNHMAAGVALPDELCNFQTVAAMAFPRVDPAWWA